MEQKTKIKAEEGKQELLITREFNLPVESLYKAYKDKELFAKWMGTNLLDFEFKEYGKYHFETRSPTGDLMFSGKGAFHSLIPNKMIVRTFEMDVFSLPPQLEFLNFKAITGEKSILTMHIIFKSAEIRNELLKKPFTIGFDLAHHRLEAIMNTNK
ncbi:ATPase [Salegentibacter salinarum]|uniref:ATPase n=1 Tax=Salegentibacter salinarum TaxID=447422 RepID=A0A2N0U1G2_9FLAO|nr:SRPBCC domain-containing protein [Salegentibacter salinarum]PKD20842.1 ATPase [Salegentibacter salinarum]SKB78522.1 Uncharacterized conserved protein YndB, AHSA1/START domain [Salegentibacter salinarum]